MLLDRRFVQGEHVGALDVVDAEAGVVDDLGRIVGDQVEHHRAVGRQAHVACVRHGLPLYPELLAEPEIVGLLDRGRLLTEGLLVDHVPHAIGGRSVVLDANLLSFGGEHEVHVLSLGGGFLRGLPGEVPRELRQRVAFAFDVEGFVPSERCPDDLRPVRGDHLLDHVQELDAGLGLRQVLAQVGVGIEHDALRPYFLLGGEDIFRGLRRHVLKGVLVAALYGDERNEYLFHPAVVKVVGYLLGDLGLLLSFELHRVRVNIQCSHETMSLSAPSPQKGRRPCLWMRRVVLKTFERAPTLPINK